MAEAANTTGSAGANAIIDAETLRKELQSVTGTQRAAVLMLLLGEEQAASIISFLNPKEVHALGVAMVQVAELSQEAVNAVLDDFVTTIKRQTSLGLGTADYVDKVFRRALGNDKAASVLGRINPGHSSKGLDISDLDGRPLNCRHDSSRAPPGGGHYSVGAGERGCG